MAGTSLDPETFLPMFLADALLKKEVGEWSLLDVKDRWPNLKVEAELMEFLKDVASFANGPQDGVLVFGVSQKPFAVQGQPFSASGYADTGQIEQLVNSRIYPRIRLNGDLNWSNTPLSYALVEQSHNRPHFVLDWKGKSVPRKCPQCKKTSDMPGPNFRNALFWRSGSTTCGPQSGQREYPDRVELDAMYMDRPGSFGRLHVSPDPQFKGSMSAGPKKPLTLSLPISIFNIGNLGTSVCGLWVGGSMHRKRGKGPESIDIFRQFHGMLAHLNSNHTLFPLYLAPGDGVSARVEIFLPVHLPPPKTAFDRQMYSLDVVVSAVDPLGTEWTQAISTEAHY